MVVELGIAYLLFFFCYYWPKSIKLNKTHEVIFKSMKQYIKLGKMSCCFNFYQSHIMAVKILSSVCEHLGEHRIYEIISEAQVANHPACSE